MSYIGRNIDSINNISTLDNLSFNGSDATFNLTQNSVAFVPVSADALQIQIDGVIQANNFTISGSTLTFDFTPNSGSVCNSIKHFGVGLLTTVSDGAITEAKIGSGAVTSSKIASGVIPTSRPNAQALIINGNMAVAQRSTSVTSITSGGFKTVDRFKLNLNSLGTWTQTQNTLSASDTPFTHGFTKSLKMDVTTADSSPSANDDCQIYYLPEGQDLQLLKKGTANAEKITIGFWIKATKTGTNILAIYDRDNNRLNSQSYTVSSSDTWEYKVVNFPADTTGAIDNDNNKSFEIRWVLGVGSTYTSGSLQTTWATYSDANYAVGQVNNADSTSNNWEITGVQLEVGEFTSATLPPFQHENYGDNLARCQRYFQMRAEGNQKIISIAHWGSGSEVDFIMQIPFMRTRPSVEYTTGNEYWAIGGGGSTNTLDNLNMNSWSTEMNINLWTTTGAGGTTGFAYYGYSNNSSAKLGFTAEL